MLNIKTVNLSLMSTNCYIAKNDDGSAFVVDPAIYSAHLQRELKNGGVEKIDYVLLTHGHFDHICGAQKLRELYGAKIVISALEADFLLNPKLSLMSTAFSKNYAVGSADILVGDGDVIDFHGEKISVMLTPGHTRGGVCYITGRTVFCGDTVFSGSVGRTDLPTGDFGALMKSVRHISALEGDYRLLPGHGPETTLSAERQTNAYFREAQNEPCD